MMGALSPALKDSILELKALFFDVDGILTLKHRSLQPAFLDNPIFLEDLRGLERLKEAGFFIVIVSSGNSKSAKNALLELGIEYLYFGRKEKISALEEIMAVHGLDKKNCAHMGDGPADLELFSQVNVSFTVPEASADLKKVATYCTEKSGGWGAVAEVADLILHYHQGCH